MSARPRVSRPRPTERGRAALQGRARSVYDGWALAPVHRQSTRCGSPNSIMCPAEHANNGTSPAGTTDNSPPVHWRVTSHKAETVPEARLNHAERSTTTQAPEDDKKVEQSFLGRVLTGSDSQSRKPHATRNRGIPPLTKNVNDGAPGFWTLGLGLLFRLLLTSSIQTRRIAALIIRRAGAAGRDASVYGIRKPPLHGR